MEQQERLKKQIAFALEADKEKLIERQTYLSGGERKENDAEHAWHLAVMAILLAEHSNEKIDVLKTVTMVLLHDLVEIDAGDAYCYDEEAKKNQKEREEKAAARLYGMLPEDQAEKLLGIWREFEAWETPEAKFARTLDNFQPCVLNDASGGRSWIEHGICLSQVLGRNERTAEGSETLWQYQKENLILPHVEAGHLKNE